MEKMLEDFADLDLEEVGASREREDRMRAAFEKSKHNYAREQVYTEPEWYDPPEIPPPTKLHIRNIDYNLNNLYLTRRYPEALALALPQIEAEESKSFGEGREFQLIDTAIRCALKVGNTELAGQLADKTIRKWSSNVGLAATSAEAYLAASRPRNALGAILMAISIRGRWLPYIVILRSALQSLSKVQGDNEALTTLISIVNAYVLQRTTPDAKAPAIADEATAKTWLGECGIIGIDQQVLLSLLCHRPSSATDETEPRSVRTL